MKDIHGGNIWAAARATGRPPGDWLDFSASINPLGAPPWVRAAARAALGQVAHYPDPECAGLASAAAARYGLDPACIRFGNGAAELIHLLVAALAPKAGLVLAPTFSRYAAALRQAGAAVTELDAWPDPPSAAALAGWMASAPDPAVIFLCNPNNPTGRLLPPELLQAALAQERVWVVVDEAFLDFVPGADSLLSLAGRHPRLVVLKSLTKLYAIPGLRLGWLAGPPGLVARLRQLQVPWSVNGPAAAAGLAALTGPESDWTERTQRAVVRGRATAFRRLAPLASWLQPQPSDCNYYLVRLTGVTGTTLQERLLPHGILVRICSGFSGLSDEYLRLAVRPSGETARLANALAAVLL
ncbi:MAG TPA: threonine-phosphate decarboxylase CobD [Symbiobacteriaceae bacterium]|jgi:threonine-phosphate decarboxylase